MNELLKKLGFKGLTDFKNYMLANAKAGEFGGKNHTEERNGFELNYSSNCIKKFGIGGVFNGMFINNRF